MTAGLWIHHSQLPYTSDARCYNLSLYYMIWLYHMIFHGTRCSALRWFTCNFWQLFGRYFMRNKINTLTELIKKPAKFFFLPGENAFYTLHWATVSLFSPHRCQQCAQPHDASFPLWKCFVQLSSFIVCQHWGLLSLQYTLGPKEIS